MLRFTIITTTYNRPKLLERAILSVIEQSYEFWSMIIVNDGSCENYDFIDLYLKDSRVTYIPLNNNHGSNYARNEALKHICKEKAIGALTFLDDDDFFMNDTLLIAQEKIKKYSNVEWFIFNSINQLGKITNSINKSNCNYVNDIMYTKNTIGDVCHFIKINSTDNCFFTTKIKNGFEWIYFMKLHKNIKIQMFENVVKVIEYQQIGLSKSGLGEVKFNHVYLRMLRPLKALTLQPFNLLALKDSIKQCVRFLFYMPILLLKKLSILK